MTKRTILLAAIAMALASPAAAQGGWIFLGDRTVNDATDRDAVHLRGANRYTRIRICVDRAPVRFYDVGVEFANGGRQDVKMADMIRPGGCTRAIDLKGRNRDITRISFIYEAKSLGRQSAHVRVYGR